ncbi:MAG: cytochrome C oxidase subunit IV family protein [Chitinophagales bacterium]|nr:cytochrome C oxidase subunit IV family protein [Chitinophagales bacterium]
MAEGHQHLSEEAYKSGVKAVWRATAILAVVTIVEVAAALYLGDTLGKAVLNLLFILMSGIKAFFIVAEFMHLRYEMRALIISILAPTFFFVWFIIAFMMDGASWGSLRALWN